MEDEGARERGRGSEGAAGAHGGGSSTASEPFGGETGNMSRSAKRSVSQHSITSETITLSQPGAAAARSDVGMAAAIEPPATTPRKIPMVE